MMNRSPVKGATLPNKPSILIVDDAAENIAVLSEALKNDYSIRPALNGAQALKLAAAARKPDLILLDIVMPDMDGYEVMHQLQADPQTRDIPVIFITSASNTDNEVLGLTLGAADFIAKPFDIHIVKARVRTHIALSEARSQLQRHNEALLREKEMIENIILRMRTNQNFDGQNLRYIFNAVDRTNGDLVLSALTPDGRQLVVVGDFTGHGLPAAVGGPLVSEVFYQIARTGGDIEMLHDKINDLIYRQLPIEISMACLLLEVSACRTQATALNAGLPSALLIKNGQVLDTIKSQNTPLGFIATGTLPPTYARLNPPDGSCLYTFTDGVTDVFNINEESFGQQRAEALFCEINREHSELTKVMESLASFNGDIAFGDDVTIVEFTF